MKKLDKFLIIFGSINFVLSLFFYFFVRQTICDTYPISGGSCIQQIPQITALFIGLFVLSLIFYLVNNFIQNRRKL